MSDAKLFLATTRPSTSQIKAASARFCKSSRADSRVSVVMFVECCLCFANMRGVSNHFDTRRGFNVSSMMAFQNKVVDQASCCSCHLFLVTSLSTQQES